MSLTNSEIQHYTQQIKLTEIGLLGQEKLKNAKVLCIGAGGLASPLLLYLAAAGVGTIGIVDADKVEQSNLHRQILYRYEHIGQSKIISAKQQILALNPHIEIKLYPEYINLQNAEKFIQAYHIIADCTDNFSTRYLINDVCFYLNKPYVYASINQFEGQCSLFLGSISPCLRCLFPDPPYHLANCSEAGTLGILPGLLGTLQATEIIKWITQQTNLLSAKLLTINILDMQFRTFSLNANPQCNLCIDKKSIQELFESRLQQTPFAISVAELKKKLKNKNSLLIDVRNPEERKMNNSLGGHLIPLSILINQLPTLDPNADIIVYCRSGYRSQEAIKLFMREGFTSVKFLYGGLIEWEKQLNTI